MQSEYVSRDPSLHTTSQPVHTPKHIQHEKSFETTTFYTKNNLQDHKTQVCK